MTVASKRWAVPVLAAAAAAAVGLAPRALAASPHPVLPARTAAQLITAAEQSRVDAVSGTVETVANLGLPALPDRMVNAGSGFAALLTGTHRLDVWADGPQRQRLALLGDLTETDVVRNGSDAWLYDSATNTAAHWSAPGASGARRADGSTAEQQLTPQAQADAALRAVDPTTAVTVDRTARVAGRPAYQLVLTPRTEGTLIRSVRIALDAATFAPLRVQVFVTGLSAPAWQTGFTKVSFTAPAASTFRFTPPPGATVTTRSAPAQAGGATSGDRHGGNHRAQASTVGSGWASVVEFPAGTVDLAALRRGGAGGTPDGGTGALLDRLTTAVPQGRLLSTRLLSALVTPDGRVFLGAVPAHTLEQAAAGAGG